MTGALGVFVAADQVNDTPAAVISTAGALLGVVLGGFLTALLESARQRRRDKRLELAAGRLLSDELRETSGAFLRIAKDTSVRRAGIPGPVASWEQYRELLASRMKEQRWRTVAEAVLAARNMRGELEQLTATDVGLGPLPAPLRTELEQTAKVLEKAVSLLSPKAEGSQQEA
jgi:hypothetical protein